MSLISELKTRRVFRAVAIYAVVAWGIIQVADTILPRLGLPDWTVTLVIVLLLLGFPVALVLSWIFDITPDGITRSPVHALTPVRATALVASVVVLGVAGFVAYKRIQPDTDGDADFARSIAVLPFVDMSPNKDQAHLGDGITEEILNMLAGLPEMKVTARTSSFSFKDKNIPVTQIAQQLGVAHILEGSVRKAGERVRITAQLIDARTDKHLWSQQYDRDLADVFGVQTEIAGAIAEALQVHMRTPSQTIASAGTKSAQAHELYLEGLYYWHCRHADELPLALDRFKSATRHDPNYAQAWAGIAMTYALLPQYVQGISLKTSITEGKAAAARALKLEPDAAAAYAALGQIAQELEWDWPAAEKNLDRAIALNPRMATAHQWRAELYNVMGRFDDALQEVDNALELDPLSSVTQNVRGLALWRSGRHDEALAQFRAMRKRDPGYVHAQVNLVGRLVAMRRLDEAREAAVGFGPYEALIQAIADSTQRTRAIAMLASPEVQSQGGYAWLATPSYIALGELDSAAVTLERAAANWAPSIAFFARDPLTEPLRGLPAFQRYVRTVKLAE